MDISLSVSSEPRALDTATDSGLEGPEPCVYYVVLIPPAGIWKEAFLTEGVAIMEPLVCIWETPWSRSKQVQSRH